jgi:hypothetical protein
MKRVAPRAPDVGASADPRLVTFLGDGYEFGPQPCHQLSGRLLLILTCLLATERSDVRRELRARPPSLNDLTEQRALLILREPRDDPIEAGRDAFHPDRRINGLCAPLVLIKRGPFIARDALCIVIREAETLLSDHEEIADPPLSRFLDTSRTGECGFAV